MVNPSKVKETLVDAVNLFPVESLDMKKMPLQVRAVAATLLKGMHPLEFITKLLAHIPDEYIPHIVQVAEKVVEVAKGD